MEPLTGDDVKKTVAISELPLDELIVYGRQLGLELQPKMGQGELLRRIRERQELLLELDKEALLDIVIWARRPVRESSTKEQLAREIASIRKMDFAGLSDRGLNALGRLRGVRFALPATREAMEKALNAHEPLLEKLSRKRRAWIGSLISKMLDDGVPPAESDEYKFLPEDKNASSLREHIAEEGVVGGIARRLRGAADDYVREKLDEIEARIDRKLDEIDRRLGEWRDREIANRLRIIKITLVASVIVALISLGYDLVVKSRG